jgi:formate hydrogenlyase subunit 6/NADH:ubiquinone oxidoreductase subunit I
MGHLHDTKETYLGLQRRVDKTQSGLPPTPELNDILRHLFTEDEARIGSVLPIVPRTLASIARRLRVSSDELKPKLDRMADKGLVFDFHHPRRGSYYMLAPAVVGFFEFSMMRVRSDIDQKQLAALLSCYIYERPDFMRSVAKGLTPLGRTLVHETMLEPSDAVSSEVMDYERATQVVRASKMCAVSLCYCRHKKQHLGEACDKPVEICLSLDKGADFIVRHGHGRPVSQTQVLEMLDRARSLGLVQIADNVRHEPTYICNCCGCCCAQLAAINRHGIEHAISTSNFLATIDDDKCTGCGKCSRACPVQAIALHARPHHKLTPRSPKMTSRVDCEVCLGCGVCKPACSHAALTMQRRKRRVLTPESTLQRVLSTHLGRGSLHHVLFDEHDGPTAAFANRLVGAIERMPFARRAMLNESLRSRFVEFLGRAASKDRRSPPDLGA